MSRLFLFLLLLPFSVFAQKKPLDHSVYDSWQSIGERIISKDGRWVVYTITPQEGDASLFIRSSSDTGYVQEVPRGYNALITNDSRYVVFKIKPQFIQTREARIKKKKPEEFPKDSLGLIELGKDSVIRVPSLKSFKVPKKAGGWVAWQLEPKPVKGLPTPTQKTVDSLRKIIDSLSLLVTQVKNMKSGNADVADAEGDPAAASSLAEGCDLVLHQLAGGREIIFKNVGEYLFDTYGQKLMMRLVRSAKDSNSQNAVLLYDLVRSKLDTIFKGGYDIRSLAMNENGSRAAFLADIDTNTKATQKYYGLYIYGRGDDSAILLADKYTQGMQLGMTISENAQVYFSKSGNRLFFGTAPLLPLKDTSLAEIDQVKLDIWNYKDDYLQTQQLNQLNNDRKRNYLALYDFSQQVLRQLGNPGLPTILTTNEGDGRFFVAITDTGRRVESQWTGNTRKDIYALDLNTGTKSLVKKNLNGFALTSSTGKYILLYDLGARNYFAWDGKALKNITSRIKTPLYNEENDIPAEPSPYGIMGWQENDSFVFVYDRFDIWKVDPQGIKPPINITAVGRKNKDVYRYVAMDEEEKFLKAKQPVFFRFQNQLTKKTGYMTALLEDRLIPFTFLWGPYNYGPLLKSKNADVFLFTKENYVQSPDLYIKNMSMISSGHHSLTCEVQEIKLTTLNPQQASYNWGNAELYHWKTFDGIPATGILYKPEDFDPSRKYPMLIYFYEKLSDGLYNYIPPTPTPSRLNISFFVSRGYLVFAPDICYTKGHPGKDAYNYIVSGAKALAGNKWVDAKNIGIQGQSWGGYQVGYLITATPMFKAAWAGAPVVNMFSAYGGIRWESGNNRQMQYEKGQSRIGATPWIRPDLYIENSPLFHLNKATTPLVIMSNDADGAVPWYQGIEFFTAMRRLGKQVWLLNYNGEAHNLVERKNRKDIQVREQQYFDWMLKGDAPARWLSEGVPAVRKGMDWGLEPASVE